MNLAVLLHDLNHKPQRATEFHSRFESKIDISQINLSH